MEGEGNQPVSMRGRGWVKFDENGDPDNKESPGSLEVSEAQSVDVESLRRKSMVESPTKSVRGDSGRGTASSSGEVFERSNSVVDGVGRSNSNLDMVSLEEGASPTRQGKVFNNGDVIVTLLPVNERFPWVTPAKFRPELVPEELMAPCLSLTVEEYVSTMEKLMTDMRFTTYNICYKRVLVIWIFSAFMILLGVLFSGVKGFVLFGLGVFWLILNAASIFICMWLKLKMNKALEKCMGSINAGLLKHNLLLGLDDRGKVSCHKINLCFIYFNPKECISQLEKVLDEKPDERAENGEVFDRNEYLRDKEDFDDIEVVVAGRNNVRVSRKSERAEKLLLHYSQRWAKDYLRRRLDWVVEDIYGRQEYSSNTNPRHIRTSLCPCQYIEEHLRNKRQRESMNPCTWPNNPCQWCD